MTNSRNFNKSGDFPINSSWSDPGSCQNLEYYGASILNQTRTLQEYIGPHAHELCARVFSSRARSSCACGPAWDGFPNLNPSRMCISFGDNTCTRAHFIFKNDRLGPKVFGTSGPRLMAGTRNRIWGTPAVARGPGPQAEPPSGSWPSKPRSFKCN